MKIGVIGAGSWGTALANLLAGKGYEVALWAYESSLVKHMQATRENHMYLPSVALAEGVTFTNDLQAAAAGKQLVLFVPPSQVLRGLALQAAPWLDKGTLVVSASKGIETESLNTMSEVLEETLPESFHEHLCFLSGPSFAHDVATGLPTAVTVACRNAGSCDEVQQVFSADRFRVYTNDDIIGVELGGALKNVIALAAGVCDGLGFGHNTRAALITRGLAEIIRLGQAKGAKPATFAGLAGMGDLVLTCTGDLSRNRGVGMELGRGRTLDDILGGMKMVAEGVKTTLATYRLAHQLGVEVPITEQMYQVLYEGKSPRQAVIDLMGRDLKAEAE
jgi:glycerol-3-phosphate dehydrogenase (NAD(P)+)